jgi:hypothetical protein
LDLKDGNEYVNWELHNLYSSSVTGQIKVEETDKAYSMYEGAEKCLQYFGWKTSPLGRPCYGYIYSVTSVRKRTIPTLLWMGDNIMILKL